MQRNLGFWQFMGFLAVSIGGVILHFLYDWTNGSLLIAPFSGVNESTWEHMKLLYFPLLIFALIEYPILHKRKDFWCVKLIGTALGLIAIPILFYLYNGAFGKSPDWLNICIFFISAAITFIFEFLLFKNKKIACQKPYFAFLILLFIGGLFIAFTFSPPEIPMFRDPLSGTFGI